MWVEVKKAKTLVIAEAWKECFEGEGIPTRVMPQKGLPGKQATGPYKVMVPQDKEHVIKDILRKL
ncbi:MAG: hypothetical protein PHG35_00780 [Dehalococcoidales bacterium]|nr:hypothetical protein [Dehalococcoidales bacterium]